jgi:hypothetical protein
MYQKILLSVISLLFGILHVSCATKGAPQGGPVDKTPPTIISTFPALDSLRISQTISKIQLKFSESMDEASVLQSIFISPELKYKPEWQDYDELTLWVSDTLLENQTYVVAITANASDERNNQMEKSYQFAFSTGDQLDKGAMSGKIYGMEEQGSYSVFAYHLSDTTIFDPTVEKPFYHSQASQNGEIELNYLKLGWYRFLAVQDANKNQLFDYGMESIGMPIKDYRLDSLNFRVENVNFRLWKPDTTKPKPLSLRARSNVHISIRLSEPIIIPAISQFSIADSVSGKTKTINGIFKNREQDNILDIYCAPLEIEKKYILTIPAISDSAGNMLAIESRIPFLASSQIDTSITVLETFSPEDSSQNVSVNANIYLKFSKPVITDSSEKFLKLYDSRKNILPYSARINANGDFIIFPKNGWVTDSAYRAVFSSHKIMDYKNYPVKDTTIFRTFTIESQADLGELTGKIQSAKNVQYPQIVRLKKINSGFQREKKAGEDGSFRFDKLPEGKYKIDIFGDIDNNNSYSYGALKPFQFAEPFTVSDDTLRVRKRWETSGVIIKWNY